MTRLMRGAKWLALSALLGLIPTSAWAQEPAGAPQGPSRSTESRLSLGADAVFLVPVGILSDLTGPQLGPVLRVGYRPISRLELTLRSGFLFGFGTTRAGLLEAPGRLVDVDVTTRISNIPIWAGARWFFMDAPAGLYAALELGANVYTYSSSAVPQSPQTGEPSTEQGALEQSDTRVRLGYNVGLGYVLSPSLPLDFRLQFTHLNVLLRSSTETSALLSAGASVGYTFNF